MSAWRRKALSLFPQRQTEIEKAYSLYDLLFTMEADLRHAYGQIQRDQSLINRIYDFAHWC